MNLQQLLDEAPPPAGVRLDVDDLVSATAVTRELGSGVLSVAVRTWATGSAPGAVRGRR